MSIDTTEKLGLRMVELEDALELAEAERDSLKSRLDDYEAHGLSLSGGEGNYLALIDLYYGRTKKAEAELAAYKARAVELRDLCGPGTESADGQPNVLYDNLRADVLRVLDGDS